MPTASAAPSATRLSIPSRISRETRELLSDEKRARLTAAIESCEHFSPEERASLRSAARQISIAEVHAAIAVYVEATAREREARKASKAAADILLPVAREAFARLWCERDARPKAPVILESYLGSVGFVVEERRGSSIDEKTAEALEDAIGEETFGELVTKSKSYRFDDELLADATIRKKLKAAIEASDLFSAQEKAALVKEVPAYSFRTSIEGALGTVAKSGWSALMKVLAALSPVVRQYPSLPASKQEE